MTRSERIHNILTQELRPSHLEVVDESHKHAGHAGARPEGETHFRVVIVSEAFLGKGRVAAHQHIYRLLADELQNGLHALAIDARA